MTCPVFMRVFNVCITNNTEDLVQDDDNCTETEGFWLKEEQCKKGCSASFKRRWVIPVIRIDLVDDISANVESVVECSDEDVCARQLRRSPTEIFDFSSNVPKSSREHAQPEPHTNLYSGLLEGMDTEILEEFVVESPFPETNSSALTSDICEISLDSVEDSSQPQSRDFSLDMLLLKDSEPRAESADCHSPSRGSESADCHSPSQSNSMLGVQETKIVTKPSKEEVEVQNSSFPAKVYLTVFSTHRSHFHLKKTCGKHLMKCAKGSRAAHLRLSPCPRCCSHLHSNTNVQRVSAVAA